MRPHPDAAQAVLALAMRYTPVIITGRATHAIKATDAHWERYFPACKELWFADGGSDSVMTRDGRATKSELCRDLRCEFAVEDSIRQAIGISRHCRVYLVDRPWNMTGERLPRNVIRVGSLHDVVEAECGVWARKVAFR